MAGSMRETTSTIKSTDSDECGGPTVGSMRGSGRTGCSTARESTRGGMVSGNRGDGKMVSVSVESVFEGEFHYFLYEAYKD